MQVEFFFDKQRTKTVTFVVTDRATSRCAIIDPVLDYEPNSGRTYTESADKVIKFVEINGLSVQWILETHIHADHLTGANYIKQKLGGAIGIGEHVKKVLKYWAPIFEDKDIAEDGSQFDHLFKDDETFEIGNIKAKVVHTPGHTPACVTYSIQDALFTGDTIFSPLVGTARTDFPGGDSGQLFDSIQKLYQFPDSTKIYVGHEYPQPGSDATISTTVEEEKKKNVSINATTTKESYVEKMRQSQINLPVPPLILPSLQVNLRGGRTPKFIKIPINLL